MQVTSGIQCNLLSPSYSTIYAPQGDAQSRFVLIQLLEGATPWEVPAGASVIIRAAKPDGTFCFYDTNEAEESAYSVSGSTVTIELVGQVLAAPGPVLMQVDFYNADGAHLSTFTFCCQVSESVVSDEDIVSSDYFSVLTATLTEMQQIEQAVKAAYGAPLVAATAAAMTDHTRIYVYTGSEAGYSNGNWYYWDGSAWASGGVYNSIAVNVDASPTEGSTNPVSSGGVYAADAALESQIDDLKSAIDLENVPFPLVNFATTAYPTGLRNGRWNTSGLSKSTTTYVRSNKSLSPDVLSGYSRIIIASTYPIQYYWSIEDFPYTENAPVTDFGYGGDYATGPVTIDIEADKYYAFSLNVRYDASTIADVAAATSIQLVPAGTRIDNLDTRVTALEDAEVTTVVTPASAISAVPAYSIPATFYPIEKLITDSENAFNRIQGICSDGRRYLYYCLLNAAGLGLPCKYDTWTRKRVAINDSQEHDYGHCESLCYVPAWMPGFDNGSVDRIYIVDLDRTTTSSGLIHVVNADDLSYITSFATDTLPPASIIGDWWAGADHVWCCPERGEFAVESVAAVDGSTTRHNCIAVYDLNGNLLKATKFTRTNGTEFCGDCDPNFIYLSRYTGGDSEGQYNIYEHILDWNLNPIRVARIVQAAWEVEGMCHIGQDVYCSYIEDETAKGASIYRYTHLNTQHPANQVFPVQTPIEWSATSGFPLNSFEPVEIS